MPVTGSRLEPKAAFLAIASPSQGQPGLQASGLPVVSVISKSTDRRVPRTSVRPQGALGRAVWTEAAMTCQAACATSLHGAGGEGGPESSRASSSCQVAKAGEVPGQSGPGRPPLGSSLAPLSAACLGISEGPGQ